VSATAPSDDRVAGVKGSVRQHVARGTIVNTVYRVALSGIGVLRRVAIAAFLTTEEFGVWGLLVATLFALSFLKEIGVRDKYVQQAEGDQELAFQRAFTIELFASLAFFVLAAAALPLYAVLYDTPEIVAPGLVLALIVPFAALGSPIWIAYRRMQFVRQRSLEFIDPALGLVVSIVLAILGFGYWSLVVGTVVGTAAASLAAVLSSPYALRIRWSSAVAREYWSFSWPLFGLGISNLVVIQGIAIVGSHTVGVAGIGVLALATSIASFAEAADQIVSQTMYPAVCAAADRRDKLFEAFVKSNRLVLMWAVPFGVGLALFSSDLVTYVFGEQWRAAAGLMGAYGLIEAARQIGFNYSVFMRAVNDTKAILAVSLTTLPVFLAVGVPLVVALGLPGFAACFAVVTATQIVVRGVYLRRLFHGFGMTRHFARAIAPSVPAAAAVLLIRLVLPGGESLAGALGEVALYGVVTVAATWALERDLLREIRGYLRRGTGGATPVPA
jgi:O-antigen/teichoic acid export membrane protein